MTIKPLFSIWLQGWRDALAYIFSGLILFVLGLLSFAWIALQTVTFPIWCPVIWFVIQLLPRRVLIKLLAGIRSKEAQK